MADYSVPTECKTYAAPAANQPFVPHTVTRRACGPKDVVIEILYAGICHSDIHQVREEWGSAKFPMVPGHEIGGRVVAVGADVKGFTVGQHAGVGCMVDSCRNCKKCNLGDEQYCLESCVYTYNSTYKFAHCAEYNEQGGAPTYGGYSKHIVVDENYVLSIPTNLDLAAATPLLCAGITMYQPMKQFGLKPDMKFGVVGLGGLGHMGVKLGLAFGCHTTVISRGTAKRESSLNDLKANAYLDSTDEDALKAGAGTFDFIISTISAEYKLPTYLNLLAHDGQFIIVGAPSTPLQLPAGALIHKRVSVAGSLIGGIRDTQEMLNFCGKHNITCDIEMIAANQIDTAYERTIAGDVKYRFVIDTATI